MGERPILFSGEMVRAILAGRKTQTRRVVTVQTSEMGSGRFADCDLARAWVDPGGTAIFGPGPYLKALATWEGEELVHRIRPRFAPGDRLWVRETWAAPPYCEGTKPSAMHPEHTFVYYRADGETGNAGSWRPSIHMPRWASRLTLRVTGVRVERVQEISEEDARAEGIERGDWPAMIDTPTDTIVGVDARRVFRALWDSINADRGFGWDSNPWVWVVSFEREGVL